MVGKSANRLGKFGLSVGVGTRTGCASVAAAADRDVASTVVCMKRVVANSAPGVNSPNVTIVATAVTPNRMSQSGTRLPGAISTFRQVHDAHRIGAHRTGVTGSKAAGHGRAS